MTGDHDMFGTPAEPVPCNRVGCWCATYDRAVDGPLIDFGDNFAWVDPEQPTLLDGGES